MRRLLIGTGLVAVLVCTASAVYGYGRSAALISSLRWQWRSGGVFEFQEMRVAVPRGWWAPEARDDVLMKHRGVRGSGVLILTFKRLETDVPDLEEFRSSFALQGVQAEPYGSTEELRIGGETAYFLASKVEEADKDSKLVFNRHIPAFRMWIGSIGATDEDRMAIDELLQHADFSAAAPKIQ